VNAIRERLARTPPGYRFSIGRILAIYATSPQPAGPAQPAGVRSER
jgi:hypothetical protein